MKKKIAMTVMALAVSAMAGSAFAAENVPMKKLETPVQMNMVALTEAQPAINLEQMAKDKGITVKELVAQLEKEGKLTKAATLVKAQIGQKNSDGSVPMTKLFTPDEAKTMTKATYASTKAISLEDMAKEKGITVVELKAQLEKEGKITKAVATMEAKPLVKDGKAMMPIINLEDMAKEKGITVKELQAQLEKAGTATLTVPAVKLAAGNEEGAAMLQVHTINLEELAKEKGITVAELIAQFEKEGAIVNAVATTPATKN